MAYLSFISCATRHGQSSKNLYNGLLEEFSPDSLTLQSQVPYFAIPGTNEFSSKLEAFENLIDEQLQKVTWSKFPSQDQWGLIFASTKGRTEDLIWDTNCPQSDPYFEILNSIEKQLPMAIKKSLVVSNACTSSHGALGLGKQWIESNQVDHVLVVAGDLIGPFTLKGFQTLRALSPEAHVRPFDVDRDGLLLGDGIGMALLSHKKMEQTQAHLVSVNTLCEGVSATRPDTTGKNLARCFSQWKEAPDLIITHGTATQYNDLTEANAIQKAFAKSRPPRVTASKWSIGHTLGASGLIDLCLAIEIFKNQKAPGIATLKESDLPIAESLLQKTESFSLQRILISSLGFGGMCSAMEVHWQEPT